MYTEASDIHVSRSAYTRMQTEPALRHNYDHVCVQFWYNMYGKTMGTLSVFYMEEGKRDRSVWRRSGMAYVKLSDKRG